MPLSAVAVVVVVLSVLFTTTTIHSALFTTHSTAETEVQND